MGEFYRGRGEYIDGFVCFMVDCCHSRANDLFDRNNLSGNEWYAIHRDYLNLFLHLVGRQATKLIAQDQWQELMVELTESSWRIMIDVMGFFTDDAVKIELLNDARENFAQCNQEYWGYGLVQEEGEGAAGNLFWEFGKRIATLTGNSMNAAAIVGEGLPLMAMLKSLNIGGFVERYRSWC